MIANRHDGRTATQLRPLSFTPGIAPHAAGSILIAAGNTRVICAATVEEGVPKWMKDQGVSGGWVTAEYAMLPYSTLTRKARDSAKGKVDGRSTEIQRLIGRSLRAVVDLEKLGPRTLWVDCDVLQADGGTRTAAITGACMAVVLAGQRLIEGGQCAALPVKSLVAAVSVGMVAGQAVVDLDYPEDKDAAVDMNVVMTAGGQFVEVQGSGEETVFSRAELDALLGLAAGGIRELIGHQEALCRELGVALERSQP
jgi:ribonuclease PH